MGRRIVGFIVWVIVGIVVGVSSFLLFMPMSLSISCDLQNNDTYSCHTIDKAFGKYPLFEKYYTDVVNIKSDSSCTSNKRCGWKIDFVLTSGKTVSPRFYHSNEEYVPKIVFDMSQQMEARQPYIEHIGSFFSPYFSIGLSVFLAGIFVYLGITRLFNL